MTLNGKFSKAKQEVEMILDTTQQYVSSFDSFSIVPWEFERSFIAPWNQMAEICRFRKFVDAISRAASRKRLSTIIYENAKYLGGSKKTNRSTLTVRFLDKWILACKYLKDHHKEDAEGLEIMGQRYDVCLGPWQFLRPDISNIVHLAGLYRGQDDALAEQEADKDRRRAKAKAMKELAGSWKAVEHKISYLLRDPDKIKMLQPVVTKAMASIEEEIEFLANQPST